ncbi:MAG TPA: ABC transporter permease [Longimicrobiales bacterium]
METLLQDVRYALRALGRNRGLTLAAVLTLTIGIGANTAIFSAVHAVLLRPLPYPQPDRLVVLWLNNQREGIDKDVASYPNFTDWRAQGTSFGHMAAYTRTSASVTEGGDPEQVRGAFVTEDFFAVLGVAPALGRVPSAEDYRAAREQLVVLSHGLWQRRFGGDAGIVGRTILLTGRPYEVVGVMPPGFRYPEDAEFWRPLVRTPDFANLFDARSALWLSVIGRLAPGASLAQAQAQMTAVARRLEQEYPGPNEGLGILLEPLHDSIVGDVRPALLLLLGAAGFVLLIACANIANLLLARGAGRAKEIAVRVALGAARTRIARQVLTESVVLALLGGAAGLLVAYWVVGALAAMGPAEVPRLGEVTVDRTVIGFALAASLLTGLFFGVAPAIQLSRTRLTDALRDGGRGATGAARSAHLRSLLVTVEVATALVLLMGAGLLIRSFAALQSVDPGFDGDRVLTVRVVPAAARYPEADQVRAFYDEFLDSVRGLPGVESVSAISTLFLSRLPNMGPVTVEGEPPRTQDETVVSVTRDAITPGFFGMMRIPVRLGREFTEQDGPDGMPVAVVNETFVRRFLPEGDPLGRRFTWGDPEDSDATWWTIVGVVADTRRSGLAEPVRPEAYLPQQQVASRGMTVLVRTAGDPLALTGPIRAVLRSIDPLQPLSDVRTVEQLMAEAVAARRFVMLLLSIFAAVALVLAAIGIYGVMAYLVGQRTREVGIRFALGADRRSVLALVVGQAMARVLPGVALGALGALGLTRLLRSQLFGVSALDPVTFLVVAALLVGVALAASLLPARRAAGVDPMAALRQD